MKIAHLIPHYFSVTGGLQTCVHNVCQRLALQGEKIYVFHCDQQPITYSANYKLHKILNPSLLTKGYPLSKYLLTWYFAVLQDKYKFDIWQINGGYPYGAFLADFFNKNRIPCVLRCSGDDIQMSHEFDYGIRRNPKVDRIVKSNYRKYNTLIALTQTVAEEYQKIEVPADRIKKIPNGVDLNRITSFSVSDRVRQRHSIPPNATVLLSVGRNHPKKRYDLIPETLRILLDKGNDAYWIVIGHGTSLLKDGPISTSLKYRLIRIEEISRSETNNEVPADELIEYYKGSDIFVMPSMYETFGIVIIEAMAAGLPIACFADIPGIRDVMNPQCGAIAEYSTPESLAKSIQKIIHQEKSLGFAESCTKHAEQYSWDAITKQYLNLYKSLIKI